VGAIRLHEIMRPEVVTDIGKKPPRIIDSIKILGIIFGIVWFVVFYHIPSWIDPPLTKLAIELGWGDAHPWAPVLRTIITLSWWLFLLIYVIINCYQVSWAWIGYISREKDVGGEGFNPTVAILIPAYNEQNNIRKTLERCINQTYRNITQIIVVDDGSDDQTGAIVKQFASLDKRVVYFRKDRNEGKPAALNTGFQLSEADLTLFMDGDGYLDLRVVELLVPHFKDPHMGCVASLIAVHNNGGLLAKCQEVEYFFTQLVGRFCQSLEKTVLICPGAGTMVRTDIAKNIHHSPRTITEDADFTFEVHRKWRITQEPDAISHTEVPTNRKSLNNQRVRWLYGVFQTINFHRWSISKFWVLWAWIGYFMSPVTFGILALVPLMVFVFGYGFLVFFVGYGIVAGLLVWAVHAAPILWHFQPPKKLSLLVPIYLVYQQYLNLIQLGCVFAKVLKRGVTVTYGPRRIHTV